MLAEANVSDGELREYFGQADGMAARVLMVFAFRLNQALILGLARQDARRSRPRSASCPTCPGMASGPRSCATMTRSTSAA